jgi:hypothetical protein
VNRNNILTVIPSPMLLEASGGDINKYGKLLEEKIFKMKEN